MIFRKKKLKLNREETIKNVEKIVTSLNLNNLYNKLTLYELTEVHDKYEIFNKSKDSKKFIYFSYWLSGYLLGFYRGFYNKPKLKSKPNKYLKSIRSENYD